MSRSREMQMEDLERQQKEGWPGKDGLRDLLPTYGTPQSVVLAPDVSLAGAGT